MTIILIGILSFVLIASIGYMLTSESSSSLAATKRAQSITLNSGTQRKRLKPTSKTPEDRRRQIMEQLKESERHARKQRLSLKMRMLHAGIEPNIKRFMIASAILGAIVFAITFVFYKNALPLRLLVSLGAGLATGYGLPRWVLGFLGKGRMNKFTALFPESMDILVRGIKSGLPVHDGLKVIAKEVSAPLGPEFQRLVENVSVGMPLDGALEKMSERMPSPELRFFTIVIAIQAKTGGNLAEALGNLSSVLRARRMMREKIKALSSEAIASASIIGSLPPAVGIMISVVRPSYLAVMFTDPRGQFMLLVGVTWMFIGIMSMRKMINFKF